MATLLLPGDGGGLENYRLGDHPPIEPVPGPWRSRDAYAAVHVVADPLGDPVGADAIDWEATLAFRHHLWSLGFGVAEAMDTAQRGGGLNPAHVDGLIRRTAAEAAAVGGRAVYGVTTDHLQGGDHATGTVASAYLEQLATVEKAGGRAILMPSRALAAAARGPDDYLAVYDRVISEASDPVMLHWLGEAFDPSLAGYWGHRDPGEAAEVVLDLVRARPGRVCGIKVSVLDPEVEIDLRRRLPEGVRCYTGDDFNFPDLIAGDNGHHSDALLGIFDVIAPVAATALHHLDRDRPDRFRALLAPTVPLSRHLFQAPTYHYKTGIVFLAYLTGHQDHFRMVGGVEGARSVVHLAGLLRLADRAGLIPDPDLAVGRMEPVLRLAGIH